MENTNQELELREEQIDFDALYEDVSIGQDMPTCFTDQQNF